jgi:hypothetical protein
MHEDPIVAETRRLREEMMSEVGDDLDALFELIQKRQSAHPERLVSFPSRRAAAVSSMETGEGKSGG